MRWIISSKPHDPTLIKMPAIHGEKWTKMEDRRPKGIIQNPRTGITIKLVGIDTKEI